MAFRRQMEEVEQEEEEEWQQAVEQDGLFSDDVDDEDEVSSMARIASASTTSTPNDAKMAAVLLCDVLGALCILLNAFVICALVRNRRRVLANVFYVLVLHCAVVDLIRGGCLIAWGMPHLLIHTMRSIQDRLFALKINQFTLVVLRSCNLLTIFNLLVFTTNEFIVIKYPLHYRRYFRRRTVLAILALCWLVSLLFGVGSVFSNFFESAHSVMVHSGGGTRAGANANISAHLPHHPWFRRRTSHDDATDDASSSESELRFGDGVTRRQMAGLSINVLCMLMIFVLCYVCLFTVLICYGKILRTIRQFQKCGSGGGQRRLLGGSGATTTTASHKGSTTTTVTRTGSIYHKRSVHQQRTQQQQQHQHQPVCQASASVAGGCATVAGGTPTVARMHQRRQRSIGDNGVGVAGDTERLVGSSERRKKVSMPSQQTSNNAYCGRCPNCVANAQTEAELAQSRRCNSHRKWRSHLMSRHKYLIVIGTVLFVDVLFLFPYSGIQMVALLHLNNLLATSHLTTLIRWGLQILIGVHSVCQPLCYFRMTEFRRLACCLSSGGSDPRRFGGSGSSVAAGPTTRSVAAARSTAATVAARSAAAKRSIVLGTMVADGTPPPEAKAMLAEAVPEEDAEGQRAVAAVEQPPLMAQQRDRTQWVNPSVDGRQMLLIAQRRRWTRNLSLLCKEEGEEFELYLANNNQLQQQADDGEEAEAAQLPEGEKRTMSRSEGDLLGSKRRRRNRKTLPEAEVPEVAEAEEQQHNHLRDRLLDNHHEHNRQHEENEEVAPQPSPATGSGGLFFRRMFGWLRRGKQRKRGEADAEAQVALMGNHQQQRHLLGAETVVQFRKHGGMDKEYQPQQKLSGLSGLRSDSVFTASQRPSINGIFAEEAN